MKKLILILAIIWLVGVSLYLTFKPSTNETDRANISHAQNSNSTSQTDDGTNSFSGNYLSSLYADKNYRKDISLTKLSNVNEETYTQNSSYALKLLLSNISSGNIEQAIDDSRVFLTRNENKDFEQEEFIELKQLAKILITVDALKRNNTDALKREASKENFIYGGVENANLYTDIAIFIASLNEQLDGDKAGAVALLQEISFKANEDFFNYQKGIINYFAKDYDTAEMNFNAIPISASHIRLLNTALKFYELTDNQHRIDATIDTFNQRFPDISLTQKDQKTLLELNETDRSRLALVEFLQYQALLFYSYDYLETSINFLNIALYLEPKYNPSLFLLGQVYAKIKDYERSSDYLSKVSKSSDRYENSLILKATNIQELDGMEEAAKFLESNIDGFKHKSAYGILADKYLGTKHYDKAIKIYSKFIDKDVFDVWKYYYSRGIAYEKKDDWDNAEADLLKALELGGDNAFILNYLAYSWIVRGKEFDRAKEMLVKAVAMRPNSPHILDSFGWALYKTGEFKNAVKYLEEAARIMPYDPTITEHLALAYKEVGRLKEAAYELEKAIEAVKDKKETGWEAKLEELKQIQVN